MGPTLDRKRDREFQERLLKALETKKKNKLLSILNSALFLWLMTATLITVGGAYFTKRSECFADFAKVSERYYKLHAEIARRELDLMRAIDKSDYPSTFFETTKSFEHHYGEFSKDSLRDLLLQLAPLLDRFIFRSTTPFYQLHEAVHALIPEYTSLETRLEIGGVYRGDFPKLSPAQFTMLKDVNKEIRVRIANLLDPIELRPACTIKDIALSLYDDRRANKVATYKAQDEAAVRQFESWLRTGRDANKNGPR